MRTKNLLANSIVGFGWLTIAWTIGVLYLMLSPSDGQPRQWLPDIEHLDKVVHFTCFAIWSYLYLAYQRSRKKKGLKLWLALGIALALATELGQAFVPGRQPDVLDFAADVAGLTAGWVVTFIFIKKTEDV